MSQGSGLSRAYLGLVILEPNKSSSLIFLQKRYDVELSKKTREREEASNINKDETKQQTMVSIFKRQFSTRNFVSENDVSSVGTETTDASTEV